MSAPLPVCFDATRLRARLALGVPTGIDRVDLAYLQALASDPALQLSLVAHGPLGVQRLSARSAASLLQAIAQHWHPAEAAEQPLSRVLRGWLESPAKQPRPTLPRERKQAEPRARRDVPATLSLPARTAVPKLLIHTSHGQLHRKAYARWLQRKGLKGVFFVHDLIPIEYPEYSCPAEPARHAARLATISAFGRAVVVNSAATASALAHYWRQRQLRCPPITIAPLGVTLQQAPQTVPIPQATVPYFVMLGTIEPRKNHLLLLKLWRQMVAADPAGTPRLVLVGRRGWENQTVFNLLDRSPGLAAHLIECPGLSDAELLALLRGARALLNPSFAEGYGLPVAEALAIGLPVLASDLPAHREVGGRCASYLDPLDGAGWQQAIRSFARPDANARNSLLQRIASYSAPRWETHFSIIRTLLHTAD